MTRTGMRNSMSDITSEIKKRRTFAIISHPDAGKTTLTEKFLLYGGAINLAGSVKGKKTAKHAVSDWMEIEKERGISVTSSVLQFNYDGYCINILDTPGHEDFSEDTYRTLMAADSAVMVIDASKGVEKQTIKLFKVCVMRHIPIFTFINKMDREANDPFELLDEIENVLGISTCPINWPIGCGKEFKGVYDRKQREVSLFKAAMNGQKEVATKNIALDAPELKAEIGDAYLEKLDEDVELLDGASAEFDLAKVQAGDLTPVFFGSALTNFGVETFLQHFLDMTTSPLPRNSSEGLIDPFKEDFSAFVFKIQANMNKAHRDRIAFMRICSGKFEAADKSTLFLDEIGNLPYHLQAKLLTAIQRRSIVRVGSNSPMPIDIRLICATNRNLQEMVDNGEFREDLLYRINTIHIEIPSLRERKEDIIPLAERFMIRFCKQYDKEPMKFSSAAKEKLSIHPWYGNIRELEHVIEKVVIINDEPLIPAEILQLSSRKIESPERNISTLEDMEKQMIRKALEACAGNLSAVATQLGITRQTLYNKMKKFGL